MTRRVRRTRWTYGWIIVGVVAAVVVVAVGLTQDSSSGTLAILAIVVAIPPMIIALQDLVRDRPARHDTGRAAAVTWDPALNELVRELALAFDSNHEAHDVAASSGLAMGGVRESRRTDLYWQQILKRASEEGLDELNGVLDAALALSARAELHAAVRRYRERCDE